MNETADNAGLLSLLECPVCFEIMIPPIYQCKNQHLLCSSCRYKQFHCPVCRETLERSRNMWMEKMTEYVIYPCKYEGNGCDMKLRLHGKKDHEQVCSYNSQYQCKLPLRKRRNSAPCTWTGEIEEYEQHIREMHLQHINSSSDGSFQLNITEHPDNFILFDDNIFCLRIENKALRTSVGPGQQEKIYTYFFHVLLVTDGHENYKDGYVYNVKVKDHEEKFEGFVTKLIDKIDISEMASKNECLHFMSVFRVFEFGGNIVKIM